MRESFTELGGVEIDTQGDAFFFAFPRARDAVEAAVEVQRAHASNEWPEGSVVRVRMGLHTGEPALGEEGYLGIDVVRAARICMAARGGNVLLSESTRALLGSTLPEGVAIFPRGERHLKGIDEPERVYELAIEGVETEEIEEPAPLAPAAPASEGGEEAVERPFEEFGSRLAADIQEQVLRSLDRSLGTLETPSSRPPGENKDVADLAARGASLQEQILARVDAALKAKGVSREGRS
jgi:hypothetical protein